MGNSTQPQRRTAPVALIGPWQNAAEGAAAALCAAVAMAAVSLLALALVGASSFGSLGRLTMAVTAMAVGGSITAGPDLSADTSSSSNPLASMFGGGGMGASMTGAAHLMPLGVTLIGAVVLWFAFSRRLRQGQQRRFTGGEVAVRAAGAAAAAMVIFMILAGLGHGSGTLPEGAMSGMGPNGDESSEGMGGMGGLMGGSSGGMSSIAFQANAGLAGLGALLWVGAVIGAGCLISRRVRLPLGGTLDKLRTDWGRSLSAVVRTLLVLSAIPMVVVAIVGVAVGGRAGSAAGAALLIAPNALAVFLTLGAGSSWTAAMHQVQSDGSNPMAALMGGSSDSGGMMGGSDQPDRVEHLRSLSAGGWPLWLAALAVTGLILTACAYRAARNTLPGHKRPMLPYSGPLSGHFGMAERFGVVTAVTLGLATWVVSASGNFGISMFGSEMGGMQAELSGSVLRTLAAGLLVGAVAGFAGSLLSVVGGGRFIGSVAGLAGSLLSTVRGRGVR